jgi:hypothetical protein
MRGLVLDTEYGLDVSIERDRNGLITRGAVVGYNTDQCAALVLSMSQGDLKEDPLVGCGLTQFVRGRYSPSRIEKRIRAHFARVGISYDDYSNRLSVTINTKPL